jgi:ATP-dependent DNA helicase RecG
MILSDSLTSVSGIGPSTYLKLERAGLKTVGDLLQQYPIRHEDFSLTTNLALLQEGEQVTVLGSCGHKQEIYPKKRRLTVQKLIIMDQYDSIEAVWFNQPYILRQFNKGKKYYFSGKVSSFGAKTVLMVSEYEPEDTASTIHTGRLVPYYSNIAGLSSKFLRQKIYTVLEKISLAEMPKDRVLALNPSLMSDTETLNNIHFPNNLGSLEKAKERLRFEQLLSVKITQLKGGFGFKKERLNYPKANLLTLVKEFLSQLPFKATSSQENVLKEIANDFAHFKATKRLLMGEVGTGKTVIMAGACYLMAKFGFRTVVLAPTEVLANQHFQSLAKLIPDSNIKIALLTANNREGDHLDAEIIIGTHALFFTQQVSKLGLLIVDEQHKFGVAQRDKILRSENTGNSHYLMVSATPIPRSLALVLFGNTALSYLKDKPYQNKVKTYLVPEAKREKSYQWIVEQVSKRKVQVFVVCPAISENSKKVSELKTVEAQTKLLKEKMPELKIESIHSKHPQKMAILSLFASGKIDLLVTTSLIEVGLDVEKANIMIVENAERFGLSQLHQFRGRIGRRNEQAYFFLFTENKNPSVLERLRVLEKTNDAKKIAQTDLSLRGPGELLGTKQHGYQLIRVEDLLNQALVKQVTRTAQHLLAKQSAKGYTSILVKIS